MIKNQMIALNIFFLLNSANAVMLLSTISGSDAKIGEKKKLVIKINTH